MTASPPTGAHDAAPPADHDPGAAPGPPAGHEPDAGRPTRAFPRARSDGIAALAAAATPVVAAALAALALAAAGCGSRPLPPDAAPASPPADPSGPAATRRVDGNEPGAGASHLLLVVGGPSRPRAAVHDLAHPHDPGVPMALPETFEDGGLAAVVAAPDGRLAAIGQDGTSFVAGTGGPPPWTALPPISPGPPWAGPVLGATWSVDGSALVMVAGSPGSGSRRTSIVTHLLGGAAASAVEVPLEADGPAVAALSRGVVAFVGRDLRDVGTLARITASGSLAMVPVTARSLAAGGDLVAIVDDTTVRIGSLADLERGILPATPLPLGPGAGIGAVAIAPDGSAVAVVRLDEQGAAVRVEVLRNAPGGWRAGPAIALDAGDGTAIPAWLP